MINWNAKNKILIVIISFLVPILILELGSLLLFKPAPKNFFTGLSPGEMEDNQLLWCNRPGYPSENNNGPINSHGFRGEEFDLKKNPGTYRILSLGESTTYGDGIDWKQTYSYLLENILRTDGFEVQVVNAGVRAWTTYQSTQFLSLKIDLLKPDMVIFYHEINDFLPTTFRTVKMRAAGLNDVELIQLTKQKSWMQWLIQKSRFLTGIRLAIARSKALTIFKEISKQSGNDVLGMSRLPYKLIPDKPVGTEKSWMENPNRLVRLPDNLRENSLRTLINLTRKNGIKLVLIHPAYPVSKPHNCILTRIAKDENIPIIDFEDLLYSESKAKGYNKLDYFFPEQIFHPNQRGHVLLAQGLAKFIKEQNLLSTPSITSKNVKSRR